MPRRYHAYPPEFQVLNVLSTAGASILAVGYAAADVLPALVAGEGQAGAGANPWGATGLEWQTHVAAADAQLRRRRRSSTEPAYDYAK